MPSKAREYVDFWIENSVHAREQYSTPGASQDVTELVRRLIAGANEEGISEQDMTAEIGDLADYVRGKLVTANRVEQGRSK